MYRNLFFVFVLVIWTSSACSGDDADSDTEDTDTSVEIIEVDAEIEGVLSNVTIRQHEQVKTILVVAWEQESDSKAVSIEFTFEDGEWFQSPATQRTTGTQEEVVLGAPEDVEVTMKIVADGQETEEFQVTNGHAPDSMPRPTVETFEPSLASPNKWLFGSVDDTTNDNDYYGGPFWLYIIDREGRIVWYYSDLVTNPILGFPRISRDNRYVFFGTRTPWFGASEFVPRVVQMTLDWKFHQEDEMPLSDNVDQTDDGSFLFNTGVNGNYAGSWLMEYLPDGSMRNVWSCGAVFGDECYSNTVNWNPIDDTILMSFPYLRTVVEIDRASGEMVAQYGSEPGSFAFEPPIWNFEFQHFANITPEGTLMVSSHMPASKTNHAFLEFEIDRTNKVITELWVYDEGDEWAMYMGEAHRVPNGNGNIIGNYGTGGVIKEITPNKETAWYVKFDADFSSDHYNKMVGHSTLFDDIYALNRGPE